MATRCTITIEGQNSVKVYKHHDGYPSATLEWLEDFNKEFTAERAHDPSYKLAALLRSSILDAEKYDLGTSRFTGWGIVPINDDCDEEWEYHLYSNGRVSCHEVERHYN
jgi:hypothetical protein